MTATTPFPFPRETRETTILVGNGTTGPYGPTTFKVFDVEDVQVWAKASGESGFSRREDITVTKTAAEAFDTVSVTFDTAVPATTEFVVTCRRTQYREEAVAAGGAIRTAQLEKELSKQATVLSELRRDLDRAVRTDFGAAAPILRALAAGVVLMMGAGEITAGPNAEDIAFAQSYAEAAQKWAVEAEDTPVQAGLFSSLHYAAKAEAHYEAIAAVTNAAYQFETAADAVAANIPVVVDRIALTGYLSASDGGHSIYVRVLGEPTHPGKLQSSDGAWWELKAEHNVVTIEQFGGRVNDSAFTGNAAAFDAAVSYCDERNAGNVQFLNGAYTFKSNPGPIPSGIHLIGGGHSSSQLNGGTVLFRDFNQGPLDKFIYYDGSGTAYNATGGGLRFLTILAQTGTSGGQAISLYATSDTQRPGYMAFQHVLVGGTGTGTWHYSLIQDGSACTTSGTQGLRDCSFTDCYFAGATVETVQMANATNNSYHRVYVFQASGSVAIWRISGASSAALSKSTNAVGLVFVSGTLILDNCAAQILYGYATFVTVTGNATGCKFYGDAATVTFSGTTRYLASNANNTHIITNHVQRASSAGPVGTRIWPDGRVTYWGQSATVGGVVTVNFPAAFATGIEGPPKLNPSQTPPTAVAYVLSAGNLALGSMDVYGRVQNGGSTTDGSLNFDWEVTGV